MDGGDQTDKDYRSDEDIPWAVWDSKIRDQRASDGPEGCDSLGIKTVVNMLSHFGFENQILNLK